MKNWPVIAILGSAQFVMVLDGTVMNVSISTVVEELTSIYANSQVESLQVAFVALVLIALVSLFFSRGIPTEIAGRAREEPADGGDNMEEVLS